MQKGAKSKKHQGQLLYHGLQVPGKEQLNQDVVRLFFQDMGGVVQAIMGNAELLKVKFAHKLDRDAMAHLHKIEDSSEDLIRLLRTFQGTINTSSNSDDSGRKP